MAEVIGSLREDQATHGEKIVLEKLRTSLPKEFTTYVECPLHQPSRSRGRGEMLRFPDFIVLANFGVVVLEVKDWVHILKADRYGARIRTRAGTERKVQNPVNGAKRFAELLAREMEQVPQLLGERRKLNVPWGYAAILPNLPMSIITQLRTAWGGAFVLGLADLESHVASKRLKATLPFNSMLTKWEMEFVRGVINPSIIIEPVTTDQKPFLLDVDQERIVAEPVIEIMLPEQIQKEPELQEALFEATPQVEVEKPSEILDVEKEIVLNASVRLVRGVAGSGKSLVLLRRAQYLKSQYPEWKICALAYNRALSLSMNAFLKGSGIKAVTFHKLCAGMLRSLMEWKDPLNNARGWLKKNPKSWIGSKDRGAQFLSEEIEWIKEIGITSLEKYLAVERRGRGIALHPSKREAVYQTYQIYQSWLQEEGKFDWADVPLMVLEKMNEGKIKTGVYDAILVDEAQDFAPIWFAVLRRLVKADGGLIFLADDPSQSIYRYYSWREKGIPVVGRTRWLRIPYRNTREIHEAAFALIRDDEVLKKALAAQSGMMLEPDLSSPHLRSGEKPELRLFKTPEDEALFVHTRIQYLLQQGADSKSIAVLCRRKRGVKRIQKALQGLDVEVATYHAFKGLEFDIVFLLQIQECCPDGKVWPEEQLSEERRLLYMAMTRARNQLYLSGMNKLPSLMKPIETHVTKVLV